MAGQLGIHPRQATIALSYAAVHPWIVVTENAVDFVSATSCTVLLMRKEWWPSVALAPRLAESLDRWAHAHPNPGHWAHWLDSTYR